MFFNPDMILVIANVKKIGHINTVHIYYLSCNVYT